jgi:hypothetical protein
LQQQVFKILFGLSQQQLFKNISQATIGFQTIDNGGFDQTEEGHTDPAKILAAGKQSILPVTKGRMAFFTRLLILPR